MVVEAGLDAEVLQKKNSLTKTIAKYIQSSDIQYFLMY